MGSEFLSLASRRLQDSPGQCSNASKAWESSSLRATLHPRGSPLLHHPRQRGPSSTVTSRQARLIRCCSHTQPMDSLPSTGFGESEKGPGLGQGSVRSQALNHHTRKLRLLPSLSAEAGRARIMPSCLFAGEETEAEFGNESPFRPPAFSFTTFPFPQTRQSNPGEPSRTLRTSDLEMGECYQPVPNGPALVHHEGVPALGCARRKRLLGAHLLLGSRN